MPSREAQSFALLKAKATDRSILLQSGLRFDHSASQNIAHLLRQTTNLWNCLISSLGDVRLNYIHEGISEQSDKDFIQLVWMVYDVLTNGDNHGVDFEIPMIQKALLSSIKQIPEQALVNRVNDFIRAHFIAKDNHYRGTVKNISIPAKKESGSTNTIRFSASDFKIKGNQLTIFTLPNIVILDQRLKEVHQNDDITITLTRSKPSRMKETGELINDKRFSLMICQNK